MFLCFTEGKFVCIGYYEQMIVRHCNTSKSHPKPHARFNSFSQFNEKDYNVIHMPDFT